MAFRTILTITGPDMGDDDLKLAADLCDEIGAHLAVLAVVIAAPPPTESLLPRLFQKPGLRSVRPT